MAFVRIAIIVLLVVAGVCFAFFAFTGEARYKRLGLVILKWTVIAAAAFFAVLAVQRI